MSIVLQATRNESDRRVIHLFEVLNAWPTQETIDAEQFTIESKAGTFVLYSSERDRIMSEIAIEREQLPAFKIDPKRWVSEAD